MNSLTLYLLGVVSGAFIKSFCDNTHTHIHTQTVHFHTKAVEMVDRDRTFGTLHFLFFARVKFSL